jgi:hypothetical protein
MVMRKRKTKKTAAQLWAPLAEVIHLTYRKVTKAQIAAGEKALGVNFPRSYVELVTTVGAPAVTPRKISGQTDVWNMGFAVLKPAEIVKYTRMLRRAPNKDAAFDADELANAKRDVARAIWFQTEYTADDGFVWLTDMRNRAGEMQCGGYAHDYLYELGWTKDGAVYDSFLAVQEHATELIREHTEQHGAFRW